MRGNAKPRARRAQLPRGVQHDAPDDESRAEIARLTAMGTTQRTPTRESGARRAQRRPKARREPMAGGINTRTFERWILGPTFSLSGRRPSGPQGAATPIGGPLEARVRARLARAHDAPCLGMFCAMRHKTPLGSKRVKSRMAHGRSSGSPIFTLNCSATTFAFLYQSSTLSTSKCI